MRTRALLRHLDRASSPRFRRYALTGSASGGGAKARGIEPTAATGFESLAGRGARATVGGRVVAVGGPRLLADMGLQAQPEAEARGRDGRPVLHVVADGRVVGALAVEDEIRPESAEAIEQLHALGIKVAMMTGDSQLVADSVARRLGIDEVAAQVLRLKEPIDL